jgi:hypothetical protein
MCPFHAHDHHGHRTGGQTATAAENSGPTRLDKPSNGGSFDRKGLRARSCACWACSGKDRQARSGRQHPCILSTQVLQRPNVHDRPGAAGQTGVIARTTHPLPSFHERVELTLLYLLAAVLGWRRRKLTLPPMLLHQQWRRRPHALRCPAAPKACDTSASSAWCSDVCDWPNLTRPQGDAPARVWPGITGFDGRVGHHGFFFFVVGQHGPHTVGGHAVANGSWRCRERLP